MLVRLLFEENKCIGYLKYAKEIYPYEERANIVMVETNETDLAVSLGENWQSEFPKLILIDGEVGIDETWEPPVIIEEE